MFETIIESTMGQILLETITAEEKAIVEDEWEMDVVNYVDSKCNFTSKITDLEKKLMDYQTKIEKQAFRRSCTV